VILICIYISHRNAVNAGRFLTKGNVSITAVAVERVAVIPAPVNACLSRSGGGVTPLSECVTPAIEQVGTAQVIVTGFVRVAASALEIPAEWLQCQRRPFGPLCLCRPPEGAVRLVPLSYFEID